MFLRLRMKLLTLLLFSVTLIGSNAFKPKAFTDGNKAFTAAVYKKLANTEGNVLVSPLSAQIILALTQSGAKGETAEEIRNSVHLPGSDDQIKNTFKNLLDNLKSDHYTLHAANKVYVRNNLPLKDQFKEVSAGVYRADSENIDFTKNREAASTVNEWVERQTQNKIRNLVDPSILDENTALLLVNALYFQGRWVDTFKESSTRKIDFYKTAKDVIQVDAMHSNHKRYGYHESAELKATFLQMHFEGQGASLVVVLPNETEGLASLENQIEKVFKPPRFPIEIVDVALPKFKIESKTDFKKILQSLGVAKAFSVEGDLSGMAGEKGDLKITHVVQKAFIDVNEEGVEAAAATFVLPSYGGMGPGPRRPKKFIADHPFIFYVMVKDVIVFAGRVSEPII